MRRTKLLLMLRTLHDIVMQENQPLFSLTLFHGSKVAIKYSESVILLSDTSNKL